MQTHLASSVKPITSAPICVYHELQLSHSSITNTRSNTQQRYSCDQTTSGRNDQHKQNLAPPSLNVYKRQCPFTVLFRHRNNAFDAMNSQVHPKFSSARRNINCLSRSFNTNTSPRVSSQIIFHIWNRMSNPLILFDSIQYSMPPL